MSNWKEVAEFLPKVGPGRGFMIATGEVTFDGSDWIELLRDGAMKWVLNDDTYDPVSSWHSVYLASHYLEYDRVLNERGLAESKALAMLKSMDLGLSSVKGSIRLGPGPSGRESADCFARSLTGVFRERASAFVFSSCLLGARTREFKSPYSSERQESLSWSPSSCGRIDSTRQVAGQPEEGRLG